MRIAVVTDSAANLPPEMVAEHGISVVPMYLKFGERVYQDGVDLPRSEFYAKLEREEVPVSTAAPSVGDYREAFERALEHAEGVVCVTVASFVSVSFDSARAAANEIGGRVQGRRLEERLDGGGLGGARGRAARRERTRGWMRWPRAPRRSRRGPSSPRRSTRSSSSAARDASTRCSRTREPR